MALLAALIASLLIIAPGAHADSLDPPTPASPTFGENVKSNPVFTWNGVARAAKYKIQVSTSPSFSPVVYSADVYGTTATPTAELPLGTLYWHVATVDGTGTLGTYSTGQSFTRSLADAPALIAPANAAALSYPTEVPVLSWQPVAGIRNYKVELDDETTFSGAASFVTDATSFTVPAGLSSTVPRYWRVQGVSTDSAITTQWSSVTDLRSFTLAWPAATKPSPLTPADDPGFTNDIDDIEFSWSAVPGAAKYEVQTSTAPGFTANVISQATAATHYRAVSSLTQDDYYWRVRALQPNGEATGWSDVRRFTREWLDGGQRSRPTMTLPDQDAMVAGVQMQQNKLSASWSSVRGADYYELDISTSPAFPDANPTDNSLVHRRCRTPNTQWTPYVEGDYAETTGFSGCAWAGTPDGASVNRFIVEGGVYYARVRAVDKTPGGQLRTSVWSNEARYSGDTTPVSSFTSVAPFEATTSLSNPAEPIAPATTSLSDGTPKLSWKPIAGATAYRVQMARDSSFNSKVLTSGNYIVTTNTELVINEPLLDNAVGQSYFWYVLPCTVYVQLGSGSNACNTAGDAQAINNPAYSWSFRKLGKAVGGATGAAVQTDTVRLSWQDHKTVSTDGGGIASYELEVRNAADQVVDDVLTDATGYTPIDRSYADGQFTWRVRAIDAAGQGLAWSTTESFEKRSSTPGGLTVDATSTLPLLRWSPTSYAGSYDVQVFRGTDPSFPAGNRVTATTVSPSGLGYPAWVPSTAMAAGDYSWRVRQNDAYGKPGPWSTTVVPFTIAAAKPALSNPADAGNAQTPSLVFQWSAVPGAVRYKVEFSATQGFGTVLDPVTTTSSKYASTYPFAGGSTYFWRVSVLDAADDVLSTSDVRSFTAQTTPGKVNTPSAVTTGAKITVSWVAPATGGTAITGYVLRYRQQGASAWTDVPLAGDVNSYALDNLTSGVAYDIQVAASNAVGTGAFSDTVTKASASPPKLPTALNATGGDRSLAVTWTKPATDQGELPITGYVVRWTPVAGGSANEATTTATSTTITGLSDGTAYTVEVAAVNDVGRGSFASTQGTTLPSPDLPDTTIATGPAEGTTIGSSSASFTFTGSPEAVSFQCKLDGGGFSACTSPAALTGLTDGSHTFQVRSVDARGRSDASPAQRTFNVDLSAPDTKIDTNPPARATTGTAAFTYSATPVASTNTFECKLDDAPFASCASTGKTYTLLAVGSHTFSVRASDAIGNADPSPATYTWTVLPAGPQTTVSSGPGNGAVVTTTEVTWVFSGSAPGGAVTFECQLDEAAYAACTSPLTIKDLTEGVHTFAVRAVDSFNQPDDTPVKRSFGVDLTAPDTTIKTAPAATTSETTAAFTYAAGDAIRFECKLDDAAFAPCPSAGTSYSALALGGHSFAVRGVDAAGNMDATPATHAWTITAGAEPTATPTPEPQVTRCKVPKLKGKTKAAAKKALAAAHCALGKVKGPKGGKVNSQTVKAGTEAAEGAKVGVTLKKKKKKR